MIEWINILTAEALKQKRSLTVLVLILAPGLMAIFNFLVGMGGYYRSMSSAAEILDTVLHNSLNLWALIMLPMAMTLMTALNANVEYRSTSWKHLFVLPVSPWKVMMVKWVMNVVMAAISHLIYLLLILLTGWILCRVNGFAFWENLDLVFLLQHLGMIYLASILLVTIHTLAALSLENFLTVMAFGTMMMISNYFVAQSEKYGIFSPWAYPMRLNYYMSADPYFWLLIGLNLGGSLLLAAAAIRVLSRRQITA